MECAGPGCRAEFAVPDHDFRHEGFPETLFEFITILSAQIRIWSIEHPSPFDKDTREELLKDIYGGSSHHMLQCATQDPPPPVELVVTFCCIDPRPLV